MSGSGDISGLISDTLKLLQRALVVPDVVASPLSTNLPPRDLVRPCALLLSPHPDDECLTGALPLRLLREENWQIINVAVTLGSNVDRQMVRCAELAKACTVLGFEGVLLQEEGKYPVTPTLRDQSPPAWQKMVARFCEIITYCRPQAVFLPHSQDAHPTHMGTHWLGMDALAKQEKSFSCALIQTEYWQPYAEPNLMV